MFALRAKNIYKLLQNLRTNDEVENCYASGEFMRLTMKNDDATLEEVTQIAEETHPEDLEIKVVKPSIEDSFIRLMNENYSEINSAKNDGK